MVWVGILASILGVPLQQPSACSVGSESMRHVTDPLEQSETVSNIILFFFQIMGSVLAIKHFVKNSFYLFVLLSLAVLGAVAVCGLSPVVTSE